MPQPEREMELAVREAIGLLEANSIGVTDLAQNLLSKSGTHQSLRGQILNAAMLKVNRAGLLDAFLGHDLANDGSNLDLFFGQSATEQSMNDLAESLREIAFQGASQPDVNIQRSARDGVGWVITVRTPLLAPSPDLRGQFAVGIPFQGQITTGTP